ncbi:MAG: hypothetical protein Q9221_003916 [Calogaya cf. arnoldii]
MDAVRIPSGQPDLGDDAYADSVIEAARHVLDTCVKHTNRGGWVKRFSTTHRLGIIFSSYANRLPNIQCDMIPPSPPLDQAFKDKVISALHSLPTNEKVSTTFNRTREPGPPGTRAVIYLLPRREPAGEWSMSTDTGNAVMNPYGGYYAIDVHQTSIPTAPP